MKLSTEILADQMRIDSLRMVNAAKASHIGSALSVIDIIAVLYGQILVFDPISPKYVDRDRFILSKGHACTALYAALARCGFFPIDNLKTYGQNYSPLMNHVSHKVDGVEFSTGSLGHGLSFGVGKALFAKVTKKKWKVYVVMSDGELDEGSNWEALMFAAHHQLDNITAIIDCNGLQSLTTVKDTLNLEPLATKLRAFGAEVQEIDGHNHRQLEESFLKFTHGRPKVIIAHTTKGKGVSFMENSVAWHYKSPSDDQLSSAIAEIQQTARERTSA